MYATYLRKVEYNAAIHQIFMDLKQDCVSDRWEVLQDTAIQFGKSLKLIRLIECLNEAYNKFQ